MQGPQIRPWLVGTPGACRRGLQGVVTHPDHAPGGLDRVRRSGPRADSTETRKVVFGRPCLANVGPENTRPSREPAQSFARLSGGKTTT